MGLRDFALDRRSLLSGIGAASLGAHATVAARGADHFIRREGLRFTRGGRPYRYTGANAWYLAWLGSDTRFGNRARLSRELDRLHAIGVRNVRLLAGAEESPVRNSIKPGFEVQDGTLNPALLEGLDRTMAELGKRDMTAVLYLTNFWEWSGGMMSRLYWETGRYKNMNDAADPWPAFPDAASAFYANETAIARFFGYVRTLVTRTNSVTGIAYRDDPTLMAWQLAN
ncbi:MAG: mannanase, partial [Porphyrobacter sp.]|nr:mannanase [Porphyrobacter sp.]